MKSYFVRLVCQDGEHEHCYDAILRANDMEQAEAIAKSHEYEYGDDDDRIWDYSDNLPLTAFGDGTTSCTLYSILEMTDEDYAVFNAFGIPEINLVTRVEVVGTEEDENNSNSQAS